MKPKAPRSQISKSVRAAAPILPRRLIKQDISPTPAPSVTTETPIASKITAATTISGQVTEEKSGLPLAGVMVKWTLGAASKRPGGQRPIELGSAVTDDEGRFVIEAEKNSETQTALCCAQHGDLNVSYTLKKDYDKTIAQCQKAMQLDPSFYLPHFVLGWIELERGANYPKAIDEIHLAQSMETQPFLIGFLGYAYARDGQNDKALETLNELNQLASQRFVTPFCQALVYLGLREDDKAIDWLEKAYEARSSC